MAEAEVVHLTNPTLPSPVTQPSSINRYVENWQKITLNQFILRIVTEGYKIQLNSKPIQNQPIISNPSSSARKLSLVSEISSHLNSGAISSVEPLTEHFVSRVFTVKKANGKDRMIIDLSSLNDHVNKISFRMEGIESLKHLIAPNDFMISIDLSDAFFSIPLHESSKKYVTFEFNKSRYQFNVLPFGLSSSPRIFCKMLRPAIIHLRSMGIKVSSYMDDLFLCCHSSILLQQQAFSTLTLLSSLGFKPNLEKSHLIPTKSMLHLGYTWNSSEMNLSLPAEKCEKTLQFASQILLEPSCPLQRLSSFLGLVVSHKNGFIYSPIHYRRLQLFYNKSLQKFSWDHPITLTAEAKADVSWWASHCIAPLPPVPMKPVQSTVTVHTDASLTGWGMSSSDGSVASGSWSASERSLHINYLELYSVLLSVNCLIPKFDNSHIHIVTDNSTTMFYINKMGGTRSPTLCALALEIWNLCISHNVWLSASHIPGVNNTEADNFSRASPNIHDYGLNQIAFDDLLLAYNAKPVIDLFASRLTCKLNTYVSKSLDPFAWRTDAFSFRWENFLYMFPPICLISKTIEKFTLDKVRRGILITPFWLGLSDIPIIFDLLTLDPIFIPATCLEGVCPTRHKFHLVAWNISTNPVLTMDYQRARQERSSPVSQQTPSNYMNVTGLNSPLGWLKLGIQLKSLYQ